MTTGEKIPKSQVHPIFDQELRMKEIAQDQRRLVCAELGLLQSSMPLFLRQKQHWWPSRMLLILHSPIYPIDPKDYDALYRWMHSIFDGFDRIRKLVREAPGFAAELPRVGDMLDDHTIFELRQNIYDFYRATLGLEGRLLFLDMMNVLEDAIDYVHKGIAADGGEVLRYLLVSSGCAICLLDLEQMREVALRSVGDEVHPLPKRATLKLIDEQLPVSGGLFSSGSDAYLIGGHMFPENKPYPWSSEPYLQRHHVPSSSATYRLTLDRDGKMTHSPFKWRGKEELQCPKFWPIVEEFEGQIHVLDVQQMLSHEVLEGDDCFRRIPTPATTLLPEWFVSSHLVLGQHMYAIAGNSGFLFDFEAKSWKIAYTTRDFRSRETLFDLLLQFHLISKFGEIRPSGGSDLFYVLLVMEQSECVIHVVAYLVASTTGKVVCRDMVFHFFTQGKKLSALKPITVHSGAVIKADKEGKTMCAIITGDGGRMDTAYDSKGSFVFIYTFRVGEVYGFVVPDPIGPKQWREFVRVEMKDSFVFQTNDELDYKSGDCYEPVRIQACFVEDAFVTGFCC